MADRDTVLQISASLDISNLVTNAETMQSVLKGSIDAIKEPMESLAASGPELEAMFAGGAEATAMMAEQAEFGAVALDNVTSASEVTGAALVDYSGSLAQANADTSDLDETVQYTTEQLGELESQLYQTSVATGNFSDQNDEAVDSVETLGDSVTRTWSSDVIARATKNQEDKLNSLRNTQSLLAENTRQLSTMRDNMANSGVASAEKLKIAEDAVTRSKASELVVQEALTAAETLGVLATDNYTASQQLASEATRKQHEQQQQARMGMMAFDNMIGIVLPRAVVRFLTAMAPVAMVMGTAFSVIMVVQLVKVLAEKLPEAIDKGIEWIARLGTGMNKTVEEMKKAVEETHAFIEKLRDMQLTIAGLGRIPEVKILQGFDEELRKIAYADKQFSDADEKYQRILAKRKAVRESIAAGGGAIIAPGDASMGGQIGLPAGPSQAQQDKAWDEREALLNKLRELELKHTETIKQIHVNLISQDHALDLARLDSWRAGVMRSIEIEKAAFDARVKNSQMTNDEILAAQNRLSNSETALVAETARQKLALLEKYGEEDDAARDKAANIAKAKLQQDFENTRAAQNRRLDSEKTAYTTFGLDIKHAQDKLAVDLIAVDEGVLAAKRARTKEKFALETEIANASTSASNKITANETANAERRKAVTLAMVGYEQAANTARVDAARNAAAAMLSLGRISQLEMLEIERQSEEKKFLIQLAGIAKRKEAMKARVPGGGEPAADNSEWMALLAEQDGLIRNYQQSMTDSTNKGALERKRIHETEIMSGLASSKTRVDSEIAIANQEITRLRELRLISGSEESIMREEQITKGFIQAQNAQIAKIRLAEQEKTKTVAEIREMYAILEAIENQYYMDMESTRQTGWSGVKTDIDEAVSAARDEAARKLDIARYEADEKLKYARISRMTWARESMEALNQWYATERAGLERLAELYRAKGAERVADHDRVMGQLKDLEERRRREAAAIQEQQLAGWRQMVTGMTGAWTNGIVQWMTYQKTFKQAMIDSWNDIVMQFIRAIERMVIHWIAEHLIMTQVEKLFTLQSASMGAARAAAHGAFTDVEVMQTYGGAVAKTAVRTAEVTADVGLTGAGEAAKATIDRMSVLRAAAKSAAHAFSSVYHALPFPANVILAPIVAAAAFMGTMAVGAFEKGGIPGDDMIAQVHKNEMVLPSQISLGLQQIIKGPTGVSGSAPIIHLHSSPTFIGNEAWMKDNLRKQENEITRMIKLAMRKNALPSAPW